MQRILLVDPSSCRGCRRCELICSFVNEGEYNPALARIRVGVLPDGVSTFPSTCFHCDTPYCMFACPVGAISRNEIGAVVIDAESCVGCLSCFASCPLSGIFIHPQKKIPIKCNLCNGEPACASECPYGALEYVELTEAVYTKMEKISLRLSEIYAIAHPRISSR